MARESEAEEIFERAEEIDPDLAWRGRCKADLSARRIRPTRWQRDHLFRAMSAGLPVICRDYPAPLHHLDISEEDRVARLLTAMASTRLDYRVRTRLGKYWRYFTPAELADKWRRGNTPLNVTDFHIEGTAMESVIKHRVLSEFNLLPLMSEDVAWIEMMTLVVSGAGGFSDSHSDDCDGSNHCFTGRKLWLAWDTGEGLAAGLEDLDQQRVAGKCGFDITTWLTLESACWFTVEAGQTLFMPGHFTHKVITLDAYLGVGSFYIAFPNLIRTLARWQCRQPNWERLEANSLKKVVYREIPARALKRFRQLQRTSEANRSKWGLAHLEESWHQWRRGSSRQEVANLRSLPAVDRLLEATGI
jgi:hypothetical protein